jgi:molybdate transport system substrate-binding protein
MNPHMHEGPDDGASPQGAAPITGISSMAIRAALADLVPVYEAQSQQKVLIQSVGGVDAAARVQAGERFDVVFLAKSAIYKLIASGHLATGSVVDFARSGVAVAVRAGAPRPDIGSEAALRRAVLAAKTVGYSTGPSGVELAKLFERWGIAEALRDRIVTPRPGVPVAALIASGQVELGFQQVSELLAVEGVDVVGPLPPAIDIVTIFSGSVAVHAARTDAARALLDFLASPATAETKRRHGMDPA